MAAAPTMRERRPIGSMADIVARWWAMRRPTQDQIARRRAGTAVMGVVATVVTLLVVVAAVVALTREDGDADTTTAGSSTTAPATTAAEGSIDAAVPTTTTPTGRFLASVGTGEVIGDGVLHTYRVEVEDGSGIDPDEFADEVEIILSSEWGWTTADGISLQRVAEDADIVVTLATPPTVDLLCAPLRTQSLVSCAKEQRAIINLDRWLLGAEPSKLDIPAYRGYVVSHEVGHTLGHKHVPCPGPGVPAPVMMQQTHGIGDCAPNPWPVPIADTAGG